MANFWHNHLLALGARMAGNRVTDFGDPEAELRAAADATVLADLSHLGLIRLTGPDRESFLQAQLSNDVTQLALERAQYSAYCSPKGRVLASLLLWQNAGAHFVQLAADLSEPTRKRLALFVLRSKVKLEDAANDLVRIGCAGPQARAELDRCGLALPSAPFEVRQSDGVTVVALSEQRFELALTPDRAPDFWNSLAKLARPVGAQVWESLDISAGIPTVTALTQDQFIPQMLNYDAIGGISFQKGCYPGQEIVARTRYLGKLKRRMLLANLQSTIAPLPADELYSAQFLDAACGTVVNCAPSPSGGFDLLAVAQIESIQSHRIHWKSLEGPALTLLPLPYALP
jgi:tRNA-modifying protein YgfZ